MAWGQPKRSGRKACCTQRGQCSCQRRANNEIRRNPAAAPRPCTRMCGWNGKGKACTGTVRNNVCTCPNC